jgi:hypothetical protein
MCACGSRHRAVRGSPARATRRCASTSLPQATLVPYDTAALEFQADPRKWWHCINGGAGSYGTDGYNRGATDFAQALVTAAQLKGWSVTETDITGPQAGTGENEVSFGSTVHVVTVTAVAPTSTP